MASREEQEYSSQAPAPYIGQFLQKGIFPYAQQFLQQQFQNYGQADSSPFTYTGDRVAGFDPREQYGMQLSDQAIGSYRPYLGQQASLLDEAGRSVRTGQGLGRDLSGRAETTGYSSARRFDPRGIGRFYNPFEEDVVQQTLRDVKEGLSHSDIGRRDEAVSAGAFGGARSRMRRNELAEDIARGATEAVGGIRSGGYQEAATRAQQAFESRMGRLGGVANLQSQLGQNIYGMGLGGGQGLASLGGAYGGMGPPRQTLQQADIQRMMGIGGLFRGRDQSLMDLNYQNFVGQYNLPMQTLQNVGALTASLGPMAGGFGYAGGSPTGNMNYAPQGPIGPGLQPQAGIPSLYSGNAGAFNSPSAPTGAGTPPGGYWNNPNDVPPVTPRLGA